MNQVNDKDPLSFCTFPIKITSLITNMFTLLTEKQINTHIYILSPSLQLKFTFEVVNSVRRETTTIKKRGYQQRHSNCNMNERNPEQDDSTR